MSEERLSTSEIKTSKRTLRLGLFTFLAFSLGGIFLEAPPSQSAVTSYSKSISKEELLEDLKDSFPDWEEGELSSRFGISQKPGKTDAVEYYMRGKLLEDLDREALEDLSSKVANAANVDRAEEEGARRDLVVALQATRRT